MAKVLYIVATISSRINLLYPIFDRNSILKYGGCFR